MPAAAPVTAACSFSDSVVQGCAPACVAGAEVGGDAVGLPSIVGEATDGVLEVEEVLGVVATVDGVDPEDGPELPVQPAAAVTTRAAQIGTSGRTRRA